MERDERKKIKEIEKLMEEGYKRKNIMIEIRRRHTQTSIISNTIIIAIFHL